MGQVLDVNRSLFTNRTTIKFKPSGSLSVGDVRNKIDATFKGLGLNYTMLSAESGMEPASAVSWGGTATQSIAGGLEKAGTGVGTTLGGALGGALQGTLKPLLPYLILGGVGLFLLVRFSGASVTTPYVSVQGRRD